MRVSKEQAAENRARILTETARMIREAGIGGVGVDALTKAAGLTHGSLYSRFGSKERLVAEALAHALKTSDSRLLTELACGAPGQGLAAVVARYLSARHRDAPGGGCALAALGPEAARQGGAVRQVFTRGVRGFAARLAAVIPDRGAQPPEDAALATVAALVGALILARAVDDPELSDRILAATAKRLTAADDTAAGGPPSR
ncbi:MAG: TetR/AcrR family transcriptional regulator [Acetobacteraceae bacterium]|nr:TetR/AcrR family transcriptional regulator [Acetobacteraceae bacterium]